MAFLQNRKTGYIWLTLLASSALFLAVLCPAQTSGSSSQAQQPDQKQSAQTAGQKSAQEAKPSTKAKQEANPFPDDAPGAAPTKEASPDSSSHDSVPDSPSQGKSSGPPAHDDSHAPPSGEQGYSSSRSGYQDDPSDDKTTVLESVPEVVHRKAISSRKEIEVGNFYLDQGNWKGALARFQSAYKIAPDDADAAFGLAEAERHLDLNNEAILHYQAVLALDPEGNHAKAARKQLRKLGAPETTKAP